MIISEFYQQSKNQAHVSVLSNNNLKYWEEIWKKPYFEEYKESGLIFYKDGRVQNYYFNVNNQRVLIRGNADVICEPETYKLKNDTLFIDGCGFRFAFIVRKLTQDSLELKEISKYGYFPNFGFSIDTMKFLLVKSKDQITNLKEDNENYKNGPVKVIYKNNKQ